jgi:trimeric autotransporter adhesin
MKRYQMLAALAVICLCSTTAFSQSRDIGARRLILDDGAGGTLTIEYTGPGSATMTIPAGGGSLNPMGTTLNSTLAWDGSAWIENLNLLADPVAGGLTITGGIDNNSGGITNTGAISAATTVDASDSYLVGGLHALSLFGTGNTRVGYAASGAISSGSYNTSIGFQAGRTLSSGINNTYIGTQAGDDNSAGNENTAVGKDAGYLSAGNANSYFGVYAGYFATGSNNTFVGKASGFANTTGDNNTYLGANAGGSAALTNATAIGRSATATANNQIVLGNPSVNQVTTSGAINSGLGYTIAGAATSGQYLRGNGTRFVSGPIDVTDVPTNMTSYIQNTGTPQSASFTILGQGTVANDFTASGRSFLGNGDDDIAINAGSGQFWLASNALNISFTGAISGATTVDASIAYRIGGAHALSLLNTNTRVGYDAGVALTAGQWNTMVGYAAGAVMTDGLDNTLVGVEAGSQNLVSGSQNTMVGKRAGIYSAGDANTLIGMSAGAVNQGNNNTFIGEQAGGMNSSGTNNTYVGSGSAGSSTISNASVLGAGAVAMVDNQVVLGNTSVTEVLTTGNLNAPSATLSSLNVSSSFGDKYAGILILDDASVDGIEDYSNSQLTFNSIVTVTMRTDIGAISVVSAMPGAGTLAIKFSNVVPDGAQMSYIIINP